MNGELILEKKLQISKNEETYYNNNRVYTNIEKYSTTKSKSPNPSFFIEKSGSELNRYPVNLPTYMRMMDNPNYRNIAHKNEKGNPAEMM